jgi:hypothetical protein
MSDNWIREAGITSIPTKSKLLSIKVKALNLWSRVRVFPINLNREEREARFEMMRGADNFDVNELAASVRKRRKELYEHQRPTDGA